MLLKKETLTHNTTQRTGPQRLRTDSAHAVLTHTTRGHTSNTDSHVLLRGVVLKARSEEDQERVVVCPLHQRRGLALLRRQYHIGERKQTQCCHGYRPT